MEVARIPADAVRSGERFWMDELRRRLGVPDEPDEPLARQLVYGPVQLHRAVLAVLESVAAGFVDGSRWVIEIHDELDIIEDLLPPYFGLFAAIDRLWGGAYAPDEIVLGDEWSLASPPQGRSGL